MNRSVFLLYPNKDAGFIGRPHLHNGTTLGTSRQVINIERQRWCSQLICIWPASLPTRRQALAYRWIFPELINISVWAVVVSAGRKEGKKEKEQARYANEAAPLPIFASCSFRSPLGCVGFLNRYLTMGSDRIERLGSDEMRDRRPPESTQES